MTGFEKTTRGMVDRGTWPSGPWDDEPDKVEWIDDATGLACMIARHPFQGNLCGYVGVPDEHPWFGVARDHLDPRPNVHGGVGCAAPGAGCRWWIGFDCAHAGDVVPAFGGVQSGFKGWHYRDVAFVRAECEELARQASNAARVAA